MPSYFKFFKIGVGLTFQSLTMHDISQLLLNQMALEIQLYENL